MELNDEQQRAVSHLGGPLLVVAGPGSGKTHVIVEKVARLAAGGIPQESILCMTFTEKAAGEMRQRLQERGAGEAWVGTIHSLCLEILKENHVKTGITEKTTIFGEMPRLAWCVRNLDEFGIDPKIVQLDRDPRGQCASMLDAVRLAKREMISAEDLEDHVRAGLAANPEDEELARLGELAKLYRAYDCHKSDKDLIDYEDMVSMTVDLLGRDGPVLEAYRKRYRHILVDEFQDNNYAQFQLARLLAGSGNITVVGDDDQSIMGFQGAFSGIFDEFGEAYPDSESVTLGRNYRCSGNISEISTQLLRPDTSRQEKPLFSQRADGEPVVVVAASDEATEREFVAKTIPNLDVPRNRMAVLCRTNESCQKFAATLRTHGIPVALAGTGNLMRNAMVVEVMALLRIANSPQMSGADISLVLKRCGVREYNIQAINAEAKRQRSNDTPVDGVFSVLEDYSGSDQDTEIREIARRLRKMSDEAKAADLLGTLHGILMEYTDAYRRNANTDGYEAARNLAILNRLYEIAEDYERYYYGRRFSDFIEYMELADDPGMSNLDTDDAGTGNAVSVMTIHKSKGKEFDTVFVTGLYDGDMPGKHRSNKFGIPAELLKGRGRVPDSEESHVRERRSLLYVAMTRAGNRLYMSHPEMAKGSRTKREQSRFLVDMAHGSNPRVRAIAYACTAPAVLPFRNALEVAKSEIQEEACKAVRESRPEAVVLRMVDLARIMHAQKGGDEDFDPLAVLKTDVDRVGDLPTEPKISLVNKETLTLSATDIDTYRECPLKFKYRKILRVPEKRSVYMVKGSVIHGVLEWLGNERLAGRQLNIDAGIRMAGEEMDAVRGQYDDGQYKKAESSLAEIIRRYAEWEGKSSNDLVGTEIRFETHIDGIRYVGKIDRVEKNPHGGYEIVDFKTGTSVVTKNDIKLNPQVNIYAAAAGEKYGSLPAKVSLVYLAKSSTIREYAVTEESLEAGLDATREYAGKIASEKFEPTPGNHCNRCPYRSICPAITIG